jgi:membrane protein implicated in regulation of membrane protease activity
MHDLGRPAVASSLLVGLALVLIFAWRREWLGRAFLAVSVVLALLWLAAIAAVRTDYHDADGYIDCRPSCSALQDGVATAIWWGPIAFVVLGVLAAVLAAVSGPRSSKRDGETRLHSTSQPS